MIIPRDRRIVVDQLALYWFIKDITVADTILSVVVKSAAGQMVWVSKEPGALYEIEH